MTVVVLYRWLDFYAEDLCGAPGPVRVAEKFTGKKHDVGLAGAENGFRLRGFGDHADGASGNARFPANGFRKANLIAGAKGNANVGNRAAAGNIDEVDADVPQLPC